jgi:succinate dehydrogenase / fumarate reductase iron-sulfur subunit
MGQIMRLRRIATNDEHIVDQNNGERHEAAFTTLIKDFGLLHEAEILPRSYGGNSWFGKFAPAAGKELLSSLPVVFKGIIRGKFNPKIALFGHKIPKADLEAVQSIFDRVESRPERYELNLYITGTDEDNAPVAEAPVAVAAPAGESPAASSPPPVDPGPPSTTAAEGGAPPADVDAGSEESPATDAGDGDDATSEGSES